MLLKSATKILKQHQEELIDQGVQKLAIFGSVARSESTSKSDVDILIEFDAKRGLFAFAGLKNYLEVILKCDVDLVTKNALHPALKPQILREAKYVF